MHSKKTALQQTTQTEHAFWVGSSLAVQGRKLAGCAGEGAAAWRGHRREGRKDALAGCTGEGAAVGRDCRKLGGKEALASCSLGALLLRSCCWRMKALGA